MAGLFGKGVGVADIQEPGIQSAPVVGSTYVRPAKRETGNDLQALARSLAGLNQALNAYADVKSVQERDPHATANEEFLNSIQGKSVDELRTLAKEPGMNQIQSDGLSTLLGSKANSDFRLEMADWYANEFDKKNGNLAAELEKKRQEYAATLPNDAARAAFFKGTEDWSKQFLAGDLKVKIGEAQYARNEAVVDEFRLIAEDGKAKGTSVSDIADQIMRQSSLNRDFRQLSGKDQNATLFQLAQEYAVKGDVDMVKALLYNKRGGVGALINSSDFGVKGYALIDAAQTQSSQEYNKNSLDDRTTIESMVRDGTFTTDRAKEYKQKGGFTDAQLAGWVDQSERTKASAAEKAAKADQKAALARQADDAKNSAFASAASAMDNVMGAQEIKDVEIPTKTGEMKTYTRKQQIDDVVNARLHQWDTAKQEMLKKGVSEQDADTVILKQKLNYFDGNGLENPEWSSTFAALPIVSSAKRLAAGGKIEGKLSNIAEEYYKIHQLNPAYARSLVKGEDAVAFLDAYSDARSFMGSGGAADPQDAIMEAARVVNMTPAQKAAAMPSFKDVGKIVKSALNDGIIFDSFDKNTRDNPLNLGVASDLVRTYMRRGFNEKTALDKAKQDIQKFAVPVNGVAVMTTGLNMQKDFKVMAESFLDDFAKHQGQAYGVKSGDELTLLRVNGADDMIVTRKSDGAPLGATFNASTLNQYRKLKQDEETVQAAQWEKDKKDKGTVRALLEWTGNGFKVKSGNMDAKDANKYLKGLNEDQKNVDRIKLEAKKQGVRYDGMNDRWVKPSTSILGMFGSGQEVVPTIEWGSDGTYNVTFKNK